VWRLGSPARGGGSANPRPPTSSPVPFSMARTRSALRSAPGTWRGARTLPGGLCSHSGFGLRKEKHLLGVRQGLVALAWPFALRPCPRCLPAPSSHQRSLWTGVSAGVSHSHGEYTRTKPPRASLFEPSPQSALLLSAVRGCGMV